jgi:hypothetical protein
MDNTTGAFRHVPDRSIASVGERERPKYEVAASDPPEDPIPVASPPVQLH